MRLIPLWLLSLLLFFILLSVAFFDFPLPLLSSLLGGGVVGGVVFLIYLFTKGKGIGEADILLAAVIGLMFGWVRGLIVFAFGNFLGLLVVLPLMIVMGKKKLRHIPLVFFLALAIFFELAFRFSDPLLELMWPGKF